MRVLPKALALHLAGLGHGRYDQTGPADAPAAFVVDMPDQPDHAWCVIPRRGFRAPLLDGYELPELEIVYRTPQAAGHQAGYDGAEAIRQSLQHTAHATWAAGTEHEQFVLWCAANEPAPVPLGPDAAGRRRWLVSVQIEAQITEASTP